MFMIQNLKKLILCKLLCLCLISITIFHDNLMLNRVPGHDVPWNCIFRVTAWRLWRWCNVFLFQHELSVCNKAEDSIARAKDDLLD